jgi:hypothetical protein
MLIEKKARVLSADAKPYSFDGRSGTSYKVRLLIDTDIYPVKTDEEGVKLLQPYVGKEVELKLSLTAPKENVRLEFVSLVDKK